MRALQKYARNLIPKRAKKMLPGRLDWLAYFAGTGKSFSEALILASTNPQYDKRLFMELP